MHVSPSSTSNPLPITITAIRAPAPGGLSYGGSAVTGLLYPREIVVAADEGGGGVAEAEGVADAAEDGGQEEEVGEAESS